MAQPSEQSVGRVAVEYRDRGKGTPFVLVHGIQGTQRAWDAVAERLLPGHRVITLNLRGRGASLTPVDPAAYTLEAFAADLESVLARVDEPVVLVGYSMGVLVCLEYLSRHGCAGLRGLVLISGSACVGDEAVWFHHSDLAAVAREAEQRAAALGLVEAAAPHAVAASWRHVRRADYRDVLPRIAVPTLVLHGTEDDQCPLPHGRLLAERMPAARFVARAGLGHNLPGPDAAYLADALARFAADPTMREPSRAKDA